MNLDMSLSNIRARPERYRRQVSPRLSEGIGRRAVGGARRVNHADCRRQSRVIFLRDPVDSSVESCSQSVP